MMKSEQINGMNLPGKLVTALVEGPPTFAGARWHDVFPVNEVVSPKLYSLSLVRKVNEKWWSETHPAFVGVADGRAFPGALIPSRSVLIGELQGDAMIALDYRSGDDSPSVTYLNSDGRWVAVAQSFDEFWSQLVENK